MKTNEPILTRGRDTWDQVSMPQSEFADRVSSIRDRLADRELDLLLIYGHGDCDGDVAYVSNLINKVPGFPYMVAMTQSDVILLNQRSSRSRSVVESRTWIDDIRFCSNVSSEVREIIEASPTEIGRVGLVSFDAMDYSSGDALLEVLGDRHTEFSDDLLHRCRLQKSRNECRQIRRSGRVLSHTEEYLVETVSTPVSEASLRSSLEHYARLHGIQDLRMLISNPAATSKHLRPVEDHVLREGDTISIYLAGRFEGYWSEWVRTFTLESDGAVRADFPASEFTELRGQIDVGEDSLSDILEIASTFGDVSSEYSVGNGMGLELTESPMDSGASADEILQPDQPIALRLPLETAEGRLGLHGNTVLPTEDGIEVITDEQRE